MDIEEIWRPVVGYEGLYEVSNMGNVKSLDWKGTGTERIMSPVNLNGYLRVLFNRNGKRKLKLVHRLVAEAFIPNPDNLPCVNHIDENKSNNHVENLEWCTHKYNINYGTAMQRRCDTQTNKNKSKEIYQYSLDGMLVKIWPSSKEIARQTDYGRSFICRCCRCKDRNKTAYGYIWRYSSL